MPSCEFEPPRPELRRTIILGEEPTLDSTPIEGANGRLIPGFAFSQREFRLLELLAKQQESGATLELHLLPWSRSLARIAIDQTTGCWRLPTYQDPNNLARYGKLSVPGVSNQAASAHRTMYGVFYGAESVEDPQVFLDHLCGKKSCCYPRHLEPTSTSQNTRRGLAAAMFSRQQLAIDFSLADQEE